MENKVDIMICFWMEKTYTVKTPSRILRSPLPRIYYYHNKRLQVKQSQYLIPTYSWTLTTLPNWTYSVVTICSFNARLLVRDKPIRHTDPITWLTTNFRRIFAAKFFSSSHDKDHKFLGYKILRCTKHSSFLKRKMN